MAYKNCCKCSIPDYWQQVSQGFRKFLRGWKANDATDNRRSKSNPCFSLAAYSLAIQPYHSCLSGSVFPSSHLNMLLSFLHYADTKLGCGRIKPLILLVRSMI